MDTTIVDVAVIGAGLAASMAALAASREGARVALLMPNARLSGSSFSSATWGLGMVCEAPGTDQDDPSSLLSSICRVGMGANDPRLGRVLVERSGETIRTLRELGCTLLDANNPREREFVACFDERARRWHGFVGASSHKALETALELANVSVLDHSRPLSLCLGNDGSVTGVLSLRGPLGMERSHLVRARKGVIVATGGCCGLWGHHLCPSSSWGGGHALALDAGATLVNMEFHQLMLGLLGPSPIVFNEKLYRHASFFDPTSAADAFEQHGIDAVTAAGALETHSGHGPFTSRLASSVVDLVLSLGTTGSGLPYHVSYDPEMLGDRAPEFVRTYFSWLRDERGIDPAEPMPVGMFAHSSNGGIRIDERCRTEVEGLYACGECAGGVHGADRIGGLASLSAATFGMVAGMAAASSAARQQRTARHLRLASPLSAYVTARDGSPDVRQQLGTALDRSCLVARDATGLDETIAMLDRMSERHAGASQRVPADQTELHPACLAAVLDRARIIVARQIALACRLRDESCGSHHRRDSPAAPPCQQVPHTARVAR